ncbi:Ig-like domain-containing protein, partial [Enterobacter cloacae subsp. dissolvens]
MKTLFSSSWIHRTSWLMILIQILSPVSLAVSSVVHAAKIDHAESTLAGMQAVIDGKPIQDVNHLPALGSENNNASGEKSSNNDSAERVVAGGASRAGQLLSSDDSTRATINYAKGIAESLINNEINDWLNQKGNGRISIGSDKTVSGDVLVPLSESDNSLLFTQGGLRTKEDRNTVNLGVGYRQYAGDWMYGVNSFYDYDYTGKNARLGVGTEAWTNYLKLAVNGYFGLTDWHQSKISSMRDYDERPANGFDLRAEAWLPSWPQLGGKLKYEQYFGKGIDLGTGSVSPDKLKDNPKALTAGLTYTPFPLISFSGERSIGDRNQTRVGMDLNYRFGVPLHQQLNSDSVDMMRSLAGNRYELVDRNYDIVMQYRKQELLRISLPETVNAQAADTVRIPVTVHKAKYGLKDTEWTPSVEFVTNGGSLRKVSATEVEVKVPAYAWNTRTGQAQEYTLKAVGTDANGNRSNTASTIIRVAPSRNVISSLTVSPDTAVPADNAQFATLTATVTDEAGQPLAAQELTFSVTGLTDAQGASVATLFTDSASDTKQLTVTTDARGQALVMVRSKIAKDGTVTVKMDNGNFKSAQVRFIADAASAQVSALKVTKDNAIADGVSANELIATVQDVNGNPLENFTVGADVDNDGIVDTSGVTDSNGNTTLKVMNERSGATTVTVRAGSSVARTTQSATVNFVVDKSVAQVTEGDLTVASGAAANGTDSNAVSVKVTDGRGNAIAGVTLQMSVGSGATITPAKQVSGEDGMVHASVTSLKAGSYTVNVILNESGNTAQADTTFVADESTAEITEANLTISPDGSVADGKASNGVMAIVTDANGNLVSGATVSFTVSSDKASIATLTGTTGNDGKATAEVTSTTAGTYVVTASVNGKDTQKNTVFVADSSTAEILDANISIIPDGSVANGVAKNGVMAIVTDAKGNLVSGATVSFAVSGEKTSITTVTGTTGADGKAAADITSTAAGTFEVTASVNGKSARQNTTFVADSTTATIIDANLSIDPDNAVADGVAKNVASAIVTDAQGNLVSGAQVNFSLSSDKATITTLTGTTGADGKAVAEITSKTAGVYKVTATVNGSGTEKNTTFTSDSTTAEIRSANLTISPDGSVANGVAKNGVTAIVTDANGNLVSGVPVSFAVTGDNTAITTLIGTTGADGKATADITSSVAGQYTVTATVNGKTTVTETTFVADSATAEILSANMAVDPDGAAANGTDKNTVTAIVTDSTGNAVPGVDVSFSVDSGATITPVTRTTDVNGKVSADITSTTSGVYKVTATVNGKGQTKDTTFVADINTAEITDANLTISPDNAAANGTAKNGVTAIVTDANGNLITGAAVTFSVETGATITTLIGTTGADGKATAEIISLKAGTYQVTATVNGKNTVKDTTFTADTATAEITSANLTVSPDGSAANGNAKNGVTAIVTDANGNLVSGAVVSFAVESGANINTVTGTTGADGKATAEITSITAGTYVVTATVNGKNTQKNTTFVADTSTAEITDANLTINPDNAPANGTDKNGVTAIVTDANGNIVSGTVVSFTVTQGATITTITGTTGADGKATAEVTSTIAGTYTVTATVNGKDTSKNTTFIADKNTAEITDANLTIAPDGSAANGVAKNGVVAIVTDARGNTVPDMSVTFTVSEGAVITTVIGTTGADGKATAEVASTTAGTYTVTATVNSKATTKDTVFVADSTTAEITDANLTINPDNAPANGTDKNGVTAVVTDGSGNVVPGAVVSFSVEDGAIINTITGTTGADGKASAEVTSLKAGVYQVTATVNGKPTIKNATFIADEATAEIKDTDLNITPDNSAANGADKNGVIAIVTDANGNVVPGANVAFTVSEGAVLTTVIGTTGADGKATAEVTSLTAGSYTVTATVNGKNTAKDTTFTADGATAEITESNLSINPDNAPANGTDKNGVTAIVTDANGNIVSGASVAFTVSEGAVITTVIGTTGADGKATADVTSLTAGSYTVTATVNGKDIAKNTTFTADGATAEITEANLSINPDNAPANGTTKNGVTAIVTDANG